MDFNNKSKIIIKLILILIFLSCLGRWPYGYYQLVRFLGFIGFGALALDRYEKKDNWFWFWTVSALLINPFFKIALGRHIWTTVDVFWAVVLFISIFLETNQNKNRIS